MVHRGFNIMVNKEMYDKLMLCGKYLYKKGTIPKHTKYQITKFALQSLIKGVEKSLERSLSAEREEIQIAQT